MTPKKIIVVFHERNTLFNIRNYSIVRMAKLWESQGHNVQFVYGTDTFIEADMCIVHIDLTYVPDRYRQFALRYPVRVNADVTNISKSKISRNTLGPGDDFNGKVIVKTDLNYGGWPEDRLERNVMLRAIHKAVHRILPHREKFRTSADYQVYPDLASVPPEIFNNPELIVEKFLPGREGDYYVVHSCLFMGDSARCYRRRSMDPIIKYTGAADEKIVDPHPGVDMIRHRMNLEIGKIDYSIHEGNFVLLDANKTFTIGESPLEESLEYYFLESNALQTLFDRYDSAG